MVDEREKLLLLMRRIRRKIDPHVLARAREAALIEVRANSALLSSAQPSPGQPSPGPVPSGPAPSGPAPSGKIPDNEASRLFRIARANNGARKGEVLALLEKRFRGKPD